MTQQRSWLEVAVGGFVVLGFVALAILTFGVADTQFRGSADSYRLYAEFQNIGGLKVRAPVKLGGVVIGRVEAINLNADSLRPVVTLQIDQQYGPFAETSSASILTSGLLGEQYIGFTPGFALPELDTEMLADGDKLNDTKSALVLEDLIGKVLYSLGSKGDE